MENTSIRQKMMEIIEIVGENPTSKKIKLVGTEIYNLATECRKRNIFINSKEKYNEYKNSYDGKNKDEKILESYIRLLNKIGYAPTEFHLTGTIILLIPIVDDFLQE